MESICYGYYDAKHRTKTDQNENKSNKTKSDMSLSTNAIVRDA